MMSIKKIVNVEFTISGRIYNLFREWLRTTKLSKQKIKIINIVNNEDYVSLESIHKLTGMSLPLLSYHINGNIKSEGLIDAEIIESTTLSHGRVGVKITDFGKEILELMRD